MTPAGRKKRPLITIKKLIFFLLALFIFSLFISSFTTKGGILHLYRRKLMYEQLKAEIDALKEENYRLASEIKALKEDTSYIEKIAREELILAKAGEIIYLLPSNEK